LDLTDDVEQAVEALGELLGLLAFSGISQSRPATTVASIGMNSMCARGQPAAGACG